MFEQIITIDEIKFRRSMYELKEQGITKTVYLLDEKLKLSEKGKQRI